jgi:hypothetical protein
LLTVYLFVISRGTSKAEKELTDTVESEGKATKPKANFTNSKAKAQGKDTKATSRSESGLSLKIDGVRVVQAFYWKAYWNANNKHDNTKRTENPDILHRCFYRLLPFNNYYLIQYYVDNSIRKQRARSEQHPSISLCLSVLSFIHDCIQKSIPYEQSVNVLLTFPSLFHFCYSFQLQMPQKNLTTFRCVLILLLCMLIAWTIILPGSTSAYSLSSGGSFGSSSPLSQNQAGADFDAETDFRLCAETDLIVELFSSDSRTIDSGDEESLANKKIKTAEREGCFSTIFVSFKFIFSFSRFLSFVSSFFSECSSWL